MLEGEHIDGYVKVADAEAVQTAHRLAKEEGIFAGFSAGANLAAALYLLESECKGKTIVVLLNDSGLKYLSTDLWG
jgi:cysteine synthase A